MRYIDTAGTKLNSLHKLIKYVQSGFVHIYGGGPLHPLIGCSVATDQSRSNI